MTNSADSLDALQQRLSAVAEVLLDHVPERVGDAAKDAAALLSELVALARTSLRADHAWILHAAASGHLPLADDVEDLLRCFELATSPAEAEIHLLRRARSVIAARGSTGRPLRVVTDGVVADVTYSAQNDKHTGIQRVTREVSPRWNADHEVTFVAWSDTESTLRTLDADERDLALAWGSRPRQAGSGAVREGRQARQARQGRQGRQQVKAPTDAEPTTAVIPWRSTVVLPEVAQGRTAGPLAAIAQHSGNAVVAIGYDAIPVASADLRPVPEPNQFAGYLTVIKHSARVAGISTSSAAEFRGFSDAVRAQGLPGPDVAEVMLAADVPHHLGEPAGGRRTGAGGVPAMPRILCVGSHELHKNHLAVLHAAEVLWREGLTFELAFMGGPGWDMSSFDARVAELIAAGRAVTNLGVVADDELWALYRDATFTVFPSLHEGFGLPVAESLACGTPVVTTSYGSTQEIAERGGCLLADPRDDSDLISAIRSLLTDEELRTRLRDEARAVPPRTWDTYAAELWSYLVDGVGPAR